MANAVDASADHYHVIRISARDRCTDSGKKGTAQFSVARDLHGLPRRGAARESSAGAPRSSGTSAAPFPAQPTPEPLRASQNSRHTFTRILAGYIPSRGDLVAAGVANVARAINLRYS
jgi:hypothetical protein